VTAEGIEHPRAFGTGSITVDKKSGRYITTLRSRYAGTYETEDEAHAALDALIESGEIPAAGRARTKSAVPRGDANAVAEYLTALAGNGRITRAVQLGALGKGLPQSTDDPAVVEQAIEHIQQRMPDLTRLQQLHAQQRIIELRRAAASLDGGNLTDRFVQVARAYGEANGIEYAAWRAMGVPAAVLKQAGVER
jgi:hypothetical protein